jgi:hypothetical protein
MTISRLSSPKMTEITQRSLKTNLTSLRAALTEQFQFDVADSRVQSNGHSGRKTQSFIGEEGKRKSGA